MATIIEVRRVIVYRGEAKWVGKCLFHSALQMGKPLNAGNAGPGEENTVSLVNENREVVIQDLADLENADEVPGYGT